MNKLGKISETLINTSNKNKGIRDDFLKFKKYFKIGKLDRSDCLIIRFSSKHIKSQQKL